MADQGTLVRARKQTPRRRRVEFGAACVVAVFAFVEFINGHSTIAVALAVGAVLLIPVAYAVARRSVGRHPDWIEVRPERITAVRGNGASWELLRNPDSVLRLRNVGGQPELQLESMHSTGKIPIARFDVDELGRVALANGWRWAGPGITAPIESPPQPTVPPSPRAREIRIQLRDGSTKPTPLSKLPGRITPKLTLAIALCLTAAIVAASLAGVSPMTIVITLMATAVANGFALVAVAIRSSRLLPITLTISPDRLAVTHGTVASQVVQRTAITSASVGRYYARLRGPEGKTLLWLPLTSHRAEVLSALTAHAWPTTSSRGGFQRH